MAATLTGTPVAVTWAAGTDPAGQSITIPSDATAVYMFWTFFHATAGHGLASATLNGNAPAQTYEIPNGGTDLTGSGVAVWYTPATGSQTLDVAWDATPSEGPTCIVAFVKGGDTTAWRDADAAQGSGAGASAVTLTTIAGDLVIALDQKYGATAPTAMGGSWTSAQTATNNSESCRLSYITAAGTTEVCTSQAVDYSTMVAVSIPEGVTYTLDQEGFAFGDDDGNEASHTLGTQDSDYSGNLGSKTLRLLINATLDPGAIAYTLRYQKNGAGGYLPVATSSTSEVTPVIETADCTVSGSNTASTSWAVSHPAASTGDLLIFGIAWDDSTTTSDVTEPAGPNGETLLEINATPVTDSGTETRLKGWYCVATGSWSASTRTFTPGASESWSASCIKIPAGEFDATTPIGAVGTASDSGGGTDTTVDSPAFSAGSSDGGGKLVWFASVDTDPLGAIGTGWTSLQTQDLGAVAHGVGVRDTAVTDSESISSTTWAIAGDSWASLAFIVRAPTVTNQVYISTSANVTGGGEATTARLTAPSGKSTSDFVTGRRWDDENGTDTIDITTDDYTEVEWVLTTQTPAANTDYFDFRVYGGATALSTYTATPRWTISTSSGATASPTGVAATGSAGSLSGVSIEMTLTTLLATGYVGTLTASGVINPTASPVGVSATAALGSLAVTGAASSTLVGVVGTGSVGTLSASSTAAAVLVGVSAAGSPGSLSLLWDSLIVPTGVAGAGEVGTLTASGAGANTALPTGVVATGSVGSLSYTLTANYSIPGVSASGDAGTVTASGSGSASTTLAGVVATGSPGSITYTLTASYLIPGVGAEGFAGTLTASGSGPASTTLVAVSAAGQIGSLTVSVATIASPTGVAAAGAAGSVTYTGEALQALTGVSATGHPGSLLFYAVIPPDDRVVSVSYRVRSISVPYRSRTLH